MIDDGRAYFDLVTACRLSKVSCAFERKESGIPANLAAFCLRQCHEGWTVSRLTIAWELVLIPGLSLY